MITKNYKDVFENQKLNLTLRAHVDVTGGSLVAKTLKPDGTDTTHAISVTNATLGYVLVAFATDELDVGTWKIKLYDIVTKVPGKVFTLYVNTVWEK